ncbi:probable LRR receptor-like serine/threonine-protein kinase At3g47570 [Macadamia integrifolia]|uniref:probable LRR receptor-like serine/threonine-protein kinase At3g47570 n=1 Tax=Macadamia integrifolia TaxID=60698 RepID=UPI001C4F442A|nr:probable LRR receptor-like serine/threonine-protein kinase At3g47570 [Macadamia integrifolia]
MTTGLSGISFTILNNQGFKSWDQYCWIRQDQMNLHVSDFGISRILSKATGQSQNQTSTIGLKGSIGCIPPEYGAGADVSTHGDIYSYGILLLEMLKRKRPTDEMFKDNLYLHSWAEKALQDGVMAVIDPFFLPMEED